MAHVIAYAAELLNNGATVESMNKYGHQLREIRKGCEYVCLCAGDFAKAAAIAADIESNSESTKATEKKQTSRAALLLVRVLFMAAGLASGLAVMFAVAVIVPKITPDGFASILLLRLPAILAAVGLWVIAYTWTVNRAMPDSLRRYIMDGHR